VRRRGIEAEMLMAAEAFLSGNAGAAETCLAISRGTLYDSPLLSEEDRMLFKVVSSEADDLPVGKLRDNWHPQFLPAKLDELARIEATIEDEVKNLCERLVNTMQMRVVEAEEQ
jgi:hypothetical protein